MTGEKLKRRDFLKVAAMVPLALANLRDPSGSVGSRESVWGEGFPPIDERMASILGSGYSLDIDENQVRIVKPIFGYREEVYEADSGDRSWRSLELLPLAKSKRVGELVSAVDLSANISSLRNYREVNSWSMLESGGWLVAKLTFLGKVGLPLVSRGRNVGEVTLAGFTREKGKVLWGVIGCGAFSQEVVSKFVGSGGEIGMLDDDVLEPGREYLVDLHQRNPLDGYQNLGGSHEILDFFTQDHSATAARIRRGVLFDLLVPSALQDGLGSGYSADNVRAGEIDNRKALHIKHVLETDNPYVRMP